MRTFRSAEYFRSADYPECQTYSLAASPICQTVSLALRSGKHFVKSSEKSDQHRRIKFVIRRKNTLPSLITHSIIGIAAGKSLNNDEDSKHLCLLSVVCSVLPDADVIAFLFGVPYSHFFGHRGFFHSPFFGLILSLFVVGIFFRKQETFSSAYRGFFYFFFITSSHGLLDAFTNGGLGIALLSPFDSTRYFFPWTPIEVSPIGIRAFFSEWGIRVILSEMIWVWTPLFLFILLVRKIRNHSAAA
jgi:inner membrane protein